MRYPGFTLVEGLIVIAILGILTGVTMPMYKEYRERTDLELAAEQVTQGLSRAKLLSELNEGDSPWGFSIDDGVLFKGDDYGTRDAAFDESYPIEEDISTSGLSEISFAQLTGKPSATGPITLGLGGSSVTLTLGDDGSVAVSDQFKICHYPPGNPENAHTLTISENAWPAHQKHGDTLGPCSGDDGEDEGEDGED